MFGWLKRLFRSTPVDIKSGSVVNVINETEKPKKKTKSKKGTGKCDFSKLTKTQLLAEAKHRGVKANASMKKQDILDRLNAEAK